MTGLQRTVAAIVVLTAGAVAVTWWWTDLFGPGTWGTGGNMVAWVICGTLTVTTTYLFRDRIGPACARWWRRHHGDAHAIACQAAKDAAAARRISADLYRHHTGKDHPDGPTVN